MYLKTTQLIFYALGTWNGRLVLIEFKNYSVNILLIVYKLHKRS